jgi:3-oxoacyl-[acyl-carrier protein] reductase/pteridine reductase
VTSPQSPLLGQSAFITGGARRIGRAIALSLARAGADITLTYRTSKTEALQTKADVEALGRRAQAVCCDVRSEGSVRAAVAAHITAHNRLDILINNAAIFETAPLDTLTLAQWDAVFETNTRGPFLVAREALPHLRTARGRIVNIGSLGGIQPWAGHAHYCASKAAVHMLTQTMAKAFAPEVAVNCVAPGWIEMTENGMSQQGAAQVAAQDRAARFAAKTPMGRNGAAEDVARAVLFFAAAAEFITGQILTVDGGLGL